MSFTLKFLTLSIGVSSGLVWTSSPMAFHYRIGEPDAGDLVAVAPNLP